MIKRAKSRWNTTVPDATPVCRTRWYVATARRSFAAVAGRRSSGWMNWGSASGLLKNQRKISAGQVLMLDGSHQLPRQNIHDPKAERLSLTPIQTGRQSDSVVSNPQGNAIILATERYQDF